MATTLIQDIRWQEQYVSRAVNRKAAGVLPAGIYWGFEVEPTGVGLGVRVYHHDDYPYSVAIVERDGFSITVRMDAEGTETPPGTGVYWLCIDAYYSPGMEGYQHLVWKGTPEAHQIKICQVAIPSGTTTLTASMINAEERDVGNPALILAKFQASMLSMLTDYADLKDKVLNQEEFLKQSAGYNPAVLYPT